MKMETEMDYPKWTDMDAAIIGVSTSGCFIYSIPLLISECIKQYEMNEEEAEEWVDFNIINSYIGENTPIHMWPLEENE
jgi:hypothetical protein